MSNHHDPAEQEAGARRAAKQMRCSSGAIMLRPVMAPRARLLLMRPKGGLLTQRLQFRTGELLRKSARLESGQRGVDVIKLLALAESLGFDAEKAIREIRRNK